MITDFGKEEKRPAAKDYVRDYLVGLCQMGLLVLLTKVSQRSLDRAGQGFMYYLF